MAVVVAVIYMAFWPILIFYKKIAVKFPKIASKSKYFWHFTVWLRIFLLMNFYIVILSLTDLF